MPELRRDPIIGYWTIISTERSKRPMEFSRTQIQQERPCPFCEGREDQTPPELFAIRGSGTGADRPGWKVRVTPSKQPLLAETAELDRFGDGLYDLMEGAGRHEIIIESPRHLIDFAEMEAEEIAGAVTAYLERFRAVGADERFRYALLFKNHGLISGPSNDVIRHVRSQLIAMPIVPKRILEELRSTSRHFERHERCVFCDILRQELTEGVRIVAQNGSFVALCPFASRAPFEIWVLPIHHQSDFSTLNAVQAGDFARILHECHARLAALLNDPPYNSILHTAPFRRSDTQRAFAEAEHAYHWYWQISPRLTQNAGFEWGTGIHINPTPPEDAALLLREASLALQ